MKRERMTVFAGCLFWACSALYAQPCEVTEQAEKLLAQMTLQEKVSMMVNKNEQGIPRLGIRPYNWWNEALHGVGRAGRATVFPQAIALAATFDTTLLRRVGEAVSDEARAKYHAAQRIGNYGRYAGLTFWSPNVNIFRDPRWGRGQETYGEDPFLAARLGVSFVRGMQGDDPRFLKVAACAKHFAVHSGPESLRHEFNVSPSRQDLFETYLPAFEALVKEGGVEAVMGAYNRVYGESASASGYLLQDILRDTWGFKGHIVSDCGAVQDIYARHHLVADAAEAAALAVTSGLNLECGETYRAIPEAIRRGLITQEQVDDLLRPLLVTQLRLGILGDTTENPYRHIAPDVIGCEAHRALARKAAGESMVLLTNKNGVLPLKKQLKSLFVCGPFAADMYVLLGNYYGTSDRMTTFLEGINAAVDPGTSIGYRQGVLPNETIGDGSINGWWEWEHEACIVSLGLSPLMEGEEGDAMLSVAEGDRLSLELPPHQLSYLRALRKTHPNKPIVAVVSGCSPMNLSEVDELADAVILTWYSGEEGGAALADILFGKSNPSGRLPVTFPANADSLPPFEEYSMRGRTYRYMTNNVLYPFGYGLSYTQFRYEQPTLELPTPDATDTLRIRLHLSNVGSREGEEVVQLYVRMPGAGEQNPLCSLVAFCRVSLRVGERLPVELAVPVAQIKEVTSNGEKRLAQGTYTLFVGGCSPSPRSAERGMKWCEVNFLIDKKGRFRADPVSKKP